MKRSRKFWIYLAGALAVIVMLIAGLLWHAQSVRHQEHVVSVTRAQRQVSEIKQTTVPVDNDEKINYFANLGDSYYVAEDYQKALDAYLRADQFIANQNATEPSGRSVNLAVAYTYVKLDNKAKAREYYQREINRLQNTGNVDRIPKLKDEMASL